MPSDFRKSETIRELVDQAGLTVRIAPPSLETSSPRETLGRYQITGQLGAGGMGEILQVRDEDIGRELAAKVIKGQADSRTLAKFLREGQITGQLEHPNIVPLYELGMTPDKQVYFTMKRIDGDDLAVLLSRSGAGEGQTLFEYLQIFVKVCDAMSMAHSQGVIHRDLKPANIMVGRFGEVQVMDWGLARVIGQPDPTADSCTVDLGRSSQLLERTQLKQSGDQLKTLAGTVLGTPHYMAPEQARGEIDRLDQSSDVYALGAILYEMLTLETPFSGTSLREVLEQVAVGEMVPPIERTPERMVPWELDSVVRRAMSHRRGDRYATVSELSADIQQFLEGGTLAAARYTAGQRLVKWARQHKALVAGVAGVMLFGVSLLVGIQVQAARDRAAAVALGLRNADSASRALPGLSALGQALQRRSKIGGQRSESDKARWKTVLAGYFKTISALDRGLSVAPDDPVLRSRRQAAGRALSHAAMLTGDFTLAAQAVEDTLTWGASSEQAETDRALVEVERTRRMRRRKKAIEAMIADLQLGLASTERTHPHWLLDDYVFALVALRDPQTVRVLSQALSRVTAWARQNPKDKTWPDADRDRAIVLCRVLGRLDLPGVVEPMAALSRVVGDAAVSVEAGLALCNTASPQAQAPLIELRNRLGNLSNGWMQISTAFRRVPDSTPQDRPRSWRDYLRIAEACREREDYQKQLAALDKLVELRPSWARAWGERGFAHYHLGQQDKALADFGQAFKLEPENPLVLANRASVLLGLDRPAQALQDLDLVLSKKPNLSAVHRYRGIALRQLGRFEEAIRSLQRAIELKPEFAEHYNELGRTRQAMRQYDAAVRMYTAAIRQNSQYARYWVNRGNVRRYQGDLKGAREDFSQALRLAPRSSRAFMGRAGVFRDEGDTTSALAELGRALKFDPREHRSMVIRAEIYNKLGKPRRALSDLDRALRLAPRYARALRARSEAWRLVGDLDRAIADTTAAIGLEPADADSYSRRGALYQAQHKIKLALADFDKAIELAPRSPLALSNRSSLRLMTGDIRGALADAQASIRSNPGQDSGYANRASARKELGDLDGTIADYSQAILLVKDARKRGQYQTQRGIAYQLKGDQDKALADFDQAIAADGRNVVAHISRGTAYFSKGELDPAMSSYRAALKVDPTAWLALFNIGLIHERRGQVAEALRAMRRALPLAPPSMRGRLQATIEAVLKQK